MLDENTGLDKLVHVFSRMHQACMRWELERNHVQEAANPGILFMLRHTAERCGAAGLTQRELADMMGIAPPTVAMSIKRMEAAGLVCKEPDGADLRKNRITLTEKGHALADECRKAERATYRRMVAGFSPGEIDTLRGYYFRMIENLHGPGVRLPHYSVKDDARL